jgi:4'-phosphopantetheinyl transferase
MTEPPINVIDVFYTTFDKEMPEYLWDKYLALLPNDMADKNSKYRRWQDRHAHLFGKLLLIEGFKKYNIPSEILSYLRYNEYDRPYITDNIDFNISHSGKFIVCCMGKNVKLGIDIEECKDIDFGDFTNVMTDDQWNIIKNSPNPVKAFFKFWTIKESVIKADSRGLSIPLSDIHIHDDTVCYDTGKWYLNEINLSDSYCACLACNKPGITVNFVEVDYYKKY